MLIGAAVLVIPRFNVPTSGPGGMAFAQGFMEGLTMTRKSPERESSEDGLNGHKQIAAYSEAQSDQFQAICDALRALIDAAMPKATRKVLHGSPVWFINENPVVGYNATAKAVNLLFWNGRAFFESDLKPVDKYLAVQATFGSATRSTLLRSVAG